MEISTISECLLFSTVRIETFKVSDTNKEDSYVGTGFVFEHEINERSALFLVTCKHVIKDMQRGTLTFTQKRDGKPLIGTRWDLLIDDFEQLWFVHPDDDIDVAVVPFGCVLKYANDQGVDLYFHPIVSSMLLTEEAQKFIYAFEEIIFIGYPGAWWDKVNLMPIIRKGITATPILIDFEGKKEFLIDASAFPGSSGSPVFMRRIELGHHRSGAIALATRLAFLGLVQQSCHERWIDEGRITSQPIADTSEEPSSQRVGLGVVLKADTIIETINAFCKEKGIS